MEKVFKDVKDKIKTEKEPTEKEEKEITPIPELKVSEVLTFSDKKDKITVETVGSYRNLFNYINTPKYKTRYLDENTYERININYRLEDNPEIELLKMQTISIVIDDKEIKDITLDSIVEFFGRNPQLFSEVLKKILDNSLGRARGFLVIRN